MSKVDDYNEAEDLSVEAYRIADDAVNCIGEDFMEARLQELSDLYRLLASSRVLKQFIQQNSEE